MAWTQPDTGTMKAQADLERQVAEIQSKSQAAMPDGWGLGNGTADRSIPNGYGLGKLISGVQTTPDRKGF